MKARTMELVMRWDFLKAYIENRTDNENNNVYNASQSKQTKDFVISLHHNPTPPVTSSLTTLPSMILK